VEPHTLERALIAAAQHVDLTIRSEPFDAGVFGQIGRRGGLCQLGGKLTLLLDANLDVLERVALLSDALVGFDLSALGLPQEALDRIALASRRRAAAFRARHPLRRVI
jgi:hypothetical protein